MEVGRLISPVDVREAIRLFARWGPRRVMEFWRGQLAKLKMKDCRLLLKLGEIRSGSSLQHFDARARLHIPFFKRL